MKLREPIPTLSARMSIDTSRSKCSRKYSSAFLIFLSECAATRSKTEYPDCRLRGMWRGDYDNDGGMGRRILMTAIPSCVAPMPKAIPVARRNPLLALRDFLVEE